MKSILYLILSNSTLLESVDCSNNTDISTFNNVQKGLDSNQQSQLHQTFVDTDIISLLSPINPYLGRNCSDSTMAKSSNISLNNYDCLNSICTSSEDETDEEIEYMFAKSRKYYEKFLEIGAFNDVENSHSENPNNKKRIDTKIL